LLLCHFDNFHSNYATAKDVTPRISGAIQSTGFGKEPLAPRPSFVRTGDELLMCRAELNTAVYVSCIKKVFVEILPLFGADYFSKLPSEGGNPHPISAFSIEGPLSFSQLLISGPTSFPYTR
jgi:hypothetical protein